MPRRSNADAPEQGGYSIRAVQRVCDLLDLLQREPGGASLARAAEVTKLPKSSAFRYLVTLEERRYVERDPATGDYRLGLALLPMQARQLDVLTRRARPYLDRLQAEFGETANLGLLDGNRVVYLDIVESPHAMRLVASRGDRDPLHSTALGKAIAAQLPDDRIRAILRAEGMPKHTDRTLTTQRDYLAQLDVVREQGYAVDDEENEVGARCVGVALPSENLPLAISVAGPAARLTSERVPEIAQRLQTAAYELAAELGMVDAAVAVGSR
ncbi:MAG: IclR family transcriptional regulator, acetate operon repressor [Solirubrobacteraceae bacterium]